jgi:hypothetical protein
MIIILYVGHVKKLESNQKIREVFINGTASSIKSEICYGNPVFLYSRNILSGITSFYQAVPDNFNKVFHINVIHVCHKAVICRVVNIL